MLGARILGVGLRGPGLNGWAAGSDVLKGVATFTNKNIELPLTELIPFRERRRLSSIVRLTLAVAEEAVENAGRRPIPFVPRTLPFVGRTDSALPRIANPRLESHQCVP